MFLIQINTNQMRVYPYTQLISVNEEQILMKQRRLCIEGKRLSLSAMDEEEIWIKGEFRKVELSDE